MPKILASPAYKADGLLIIAFAGNLTPEAADDEPAVNGALLVSPFAEAGSTVGAAYDPYSLLRSLQDLFALKPLARAAKASSFADQKGLVALGTMERRHQQDDLSLGTGPNCDAPWQSGSRDPRPTSPRAARVR